MGTGTGLWNQWETLHKNHDWAGLTSLFTSDAVLVRPNVRHEGPEAIGAYLAEAGRAFPAIKMETSLVIDDGDNVMAEFMRRGSQTGPLTLPNGREIAPTGRTSEIAVVTVAKIRDGKFATMRDYLDTGELMRQLSG